ncbi:MAG: right-handed parallel beta-helix repeat-containing protein [Fibromonadaceae bacterium]|nr:right-handed parallel beta-helix repeat-containing protein [Fibromonadaceae bacterium]
MGTEIRGGFRGESGETAETRMGDINKVIINGNGASSLLFLGGSGLPYAACLDRAAAGSGRILSVGAAPVLDYLVVKGNSVAADGGGIYSVHSDGLKISNSYIVGNRAALGGGIFVKDGSMALENSIVSANRAGNGAAVYAENARLKIRHATVADNPASAGKGVAFAGGVNVAGSANNIVWGNGGTDLAATAQDPLFKSSVAAGEDGLFFTKDDGYALEDGSPMIDRGARQADIPLDIFQISREISKDGSGLPDMGAREWFPDIAKNIQFLKKTATRGLQPVENHTILKESSSDYLPLKLLGSPYAYVLSAKIPKNDYMKDSHSGKVKILTKDKKTCGEAKNVTFYRIAEESGLVEYRTYRKKGEGIYLFLSQKEMPSYDWYHVLKVCAGGFHIEIEANK